MNILEDAAAKHGCVGGFCHGVAAGLNFQATLEEQYKALLGGDLKGAPTGTDNGALCVCKRRVVPYDANASVLYQKLSNAPTCGDSMPPSTAVGAVPLSAQELSVMRGWIEAGAPFN
jgi:hypothetical protein